MQIKLIEYIIIYFYHQFRIVLIQFDHTKCIVAGIWLNSAIFVKKSEKFMKYANYANYLIKYAFYRETPGLIEFYRKNYMRLNLGTFDTPRHKIFTGFPLSRQGKSCKYFMTGCVKSP